MYRQRNSQRNTLRSNRRCFDSLRFAPVAQHDSAGLGFVLSYPEIVRYLVPNCFFANSKK